MRPNFLRSLLPFAFLLGSPLALSVSQTHDPLPDPRSAVAVADARFTILTPQLIRMEWADQAKFEDRPSLVFINRKLPAPAFQRKEEGGWLIVQTEKLTLRYKKGSGKFSQENLEILFDMDGRRVTWKPALEDKGNLKGTIRTLDGVKGATALESGLLSRDGWVVVDDSQRPLFDASDWPWVVARPDDDHQDLYFFGYGREFRKALYDFTRVAGKIPMPPRFAFGLWWSRYWAYTDQEFKDLVREFEIHDVPLDVLVIDMDRHQTFSLRWSKRELDQAGQQLGWTGYTWDKNFFPDPEGFLTWCEQKGLKTPLNLHPASGVQPHEEHYPEMARAMGIDPSSKKYVPFDIVDKQFATNYLNLMIRPLERQGVDFWWLDWQQWGTTKIAGVTPTWWLNHVFFTDMERRGKTRPLLFHRWGGLGNHRYQIGFSGDVINVWESLAFQPYFTATAANVGFGYWSHDIGGHMPGPEPPELYTRWIQWGVFSPIIRTHTTKNPDSERRIWAYPTDYFLVMRDAILLRYAMIPYIYTAARQTYETGVSVCRPMYHDYPMEDAAYEFKDQYMFGDALLVAPVTVPLGAENLLAAKNIWLPEGTWIEWFTGKRLSGPAVVDRAFAIDEIPVYVKAGSILPMQPKMRNAHEKPVDPLILMIFPGATGSARIYEDQGNSLGYQKEEYAWTAVKTTFPEAGTLKVEISPTEGKYPGMLSERGYEVRLPGWWPPTSVTCNGRSVAHRTDDKSMGWSYDGDKLMTVIRLPKFSLNQKVELVVKMPMMPEDRSRLLDGVRGVLSRLRRVMPLLNSTWPKEWSPDILVKGAQTGNRIGINPGSAEKELAQLWRELPEVLKQIEALDIDPNIRNKAIHHMSGIIAR